MTFKIKGIHHIELTVSNLEISKTFYSKFPGFKIVAEYPNFVMFNIGALYLGLTDHKGSRKENVFNEYNVGLDHFAFELASTEDLKLAEIFLQENNIIHSEVEELSNESYIITFRDPDNIQLEFAFRQ